MGPGGCGRPCPTSYYSSEPQKLSRIVRSGCLEAEDASRLDRWTLQAEQSRLRADQVVTANRAGADSCCPPWTPWLKRASGSQGRPSSPAHALQGLLGAEEPKAHPPPSPCRFSVPAGSNFDAVKWGRGTVHEAAAVDLPVGLTVQRAQASPGPPHDDGCHNPHPAPTHRHSPCRGVHASQCPQEGGGMDVPGWEPQVEAGHEG